MVYVTTPMNAATLSQVVQFSDALQIPCQKAWVDDTAAGARRTSEAFDMILACSSADDETTAGAPSSPTPATEWYPMAETTSTRSAPIRTTITVAGFLAEIKLARALFWRGCSSIPRYRRYRLTSCSFMSPTLRGAKELLSASTPPCDDACSAAAADAIIPVQGMPHVTELT